MSKNLKLERTQWFADARYGFFFHFLNPHKTNEAHPNQNFPYNIDEWNKEVDSFKVEIFAEQLAELGAGYAFITVGQNSGYYCSPNKTFDEIMGEKRCSDRDLVSDFADALAKYDIPCLAYTTGLAPYLDRLSVDKMECVPPWHHMSCNSYDRYLDLITTDSRLVNFQNKWNAMHTEWTKRWGKKIKGWWVDGTHALQMYNFPDAPNAQSFADALRAGNPDAIIAFNAGNVTEPSADVPEVEDFTAGEMNTPFYGTCPGPSVDGLRYHLLTFVGSTWWTGPLTISGDIMAEITRKVNDNGGVVTWDLPFSAEKGIEKEEYKLLSDFKREYEKSLRAFPATSAAITPPHIAPDSTPIPGKAVISSSCLAGTEIEWNGKKILCGEGTSCEVELPPILPDGDLVLTRGGVRRRYPVTTVREFLLGEEFTKPIDLVNEATGKVLSSIAFAVKDGKLLLKGTAFEEEIVPPKDPEKLCASHLCSNMDIFFSLDHKWQSEVFLRPDKNFFGMADKVLTKLEDIEAEYGPLVDGKYEFSIAVPLTRLPDGKGDVDSFKFNISQHAYHDGKIIGGMMFGGRNKHYAPSYESALFRIRKEK